MNLLQKKIYKEIYRKSLYDFVKDFWKECDPAKFIDGKLIQFYCEVFQYMVREWIGYTPVEVKGLPPLSDDIDIIDVRQDKNKININVPPRHTKSTIFNVLGPTWLWSFYPIKVVSVSHTGRLSTKMNISRQNVINSERYQEIFNLKYLSNSNSYIMDERGGELYSVNRNSFTGYGGDIIINDDLTNAETAIKNMEEMNNAWSYFRNTMPSRVNDIFKACIMNIQQRLAPNDITGRIQEDIQLYNQYIHVVLPAQFQKDTYVVCPISGQVLVWKKGEYLWPERFGDYKEIREAVGEAVWQAQYIQNPKASDRNVVTENMIIEKNLTEVQDISQADMVYASHDFPVKDKEKSDFLGSLLGYRIGMTLYLWDCLEAKMAFKKSIEYVKSLDVSYPGCIQVIEDKANGSPILQQAQEEVPGLQAFQPGTQSKTQRLESATLYMNNVVFVKTVYDKLTNRYYLNEGLSNLKTRLLSFPYVEHDDITDAFSMMILFVFLDRKFMVYGRAFNQENIIKEDILTNYSLVFFNKEGDIWKACEMGIKYGTNMKIIVKREIKFKASVEDGLIKLKEFAPNKNVFVDCSETDALRGIYNKGTTIERYTLDDFDKSVAQLNLAFSKKIIVINRDCKNVISDISNFKFTKKTDETVKYVSTKDGFCACLRTSLRAFGGVH